MTNGLDNLTQALQRIYVNIITLLLSHYYEQTVEHTSGLQLIWDAMTLMGRHSNDEAKTACFEQL